MNNEEKILKCIEWEVIKGKKEKPKKSKSGSYLFGFSSDDLCNDIIKTFGITNEELFKKKYNEATSGDGHEYKKMNSVKSSSLCALLCFYNISKEKQIRINDITYTNSYFEVKNQVFNKPSNMDVVLTNDAGDILFVECKFSEYLDTSAKEISSAYFDNAISGDIYREFNCIVPKVNEKKEDTVQYVAKIDGENSYVGGLKQIISHYVGLVNYLKRGQDYMMSYVKKDDELRIIYDNTFKRTRFIEMIFELSDKDLNEYYKNYKKASCKLIEILNKQNIDIDFLNPTTYQEVFKNNSGILDEKVKKFYKL